MTTKNFIIQNLSEKWIFAALFLYGLFIRLPFFFRDYIDRDESSFILMGQSWVDGNLPFTELWDIKPPLIFFFFGAILYVFGKSFIAIRLIGVLLVTITSFFTYKLAKEETSKYMALIMALLCVILQSLFGSLQGVMSEHIAMACMTPAIWLMINTKTSFYRWMCIGVLVGCALMVKLNLAYVALILGLIIIWITFKKEKPLLSLLPPILYGLGALLVIAFCFLPYYLNDLSILWWKSVITAPLAYAGARTDSSVKLIAYLLPFVFLIWYTWKKRILNLKKGNSLFIIGAILGTLWAFIKGGRVNGHYLILIYPPILVLIAMLIKKDNALKRRKFVPIVFFIFFLIPVESYFEYYAIIKHKIEKGTFFNGEGISVPEYFENHKIPTTNIYFAEYHIGYWVMNKKPVTKASTQPSNILKDEMFFAYDNPRETGEQELQFILEQKQPSHIITRKNRRIFDKKEITANFYINLQLLKNYRPLDTIEEAIIHERLPVQ